MLATGVCVNVSHTVVSPESCRRPAFPVPPSAHTRSVLQRKSTLRDATRGLRTLLAGWPHRAVRRVLELFAQAEGVPVVLIERVGHERVRPRAERVAEGDAQGTPSLSRAPQVRTIQDSDPAAAPAPRRT